MEEVKVHEIVIVGAGITGSYIAYFLAKKGYKVRLIDKSSMGMHASAKNPGGLNPLHGPGIPGVMTPLGLRSFELHQQLQPEILKLSGIDFKGQLVPRLEVAFSENEIKSLETSEALYNKISGFSAEWVTPEQLKKEEPRISSGVSAALMLKGNGIVDSSLYTHAVSAAAKKLGVQFQKTEVIGFEIRKGRIEYIRTRKEKLKCNTVVLATGPWFEGPSRWLNTPLPVRPLKGQLLLAELPGLPLPYHVTKDAMGIYITSGKQLWLGGTQEDVGFDEKPTLQGRKRIITALSEIIPDITDAKILDHVAAFRPVAPDRFPVIGRLPNYENVLIASGAGVKGMLLSTGIAEALAEDISRNDILDSVKSFSPHRFINLNSKKD